MTVHFRSVARIIGVLMMILSLAMFLPIIAGIYYNEESAIKAFVITMIPCFIAGFGVAKFLGSSKQRFNARDGFLAVAVCWILASLIGGIPLRLSGAIPSYIDCFFEMCSGFSTTGSTILTDIESLPKSMLFWRSFTHWMGGMGIIVLAMAFLTNSGIKGQLIASAETPGPTLDKLSPKYTSTVRNLYVVYLIFTFLEAILLMIGGMSLFDALVHTFGTVGTGGFSSYSDSIAHFNSPYIYWVIITFMFLCGVNFNLYFIAWRSGFKKALRNTELRVYVGITVFSIVAITTAVMITYSGFNFLKVFTDVTFQVISIMTTTGYATADYDIWPTFARILILLIMFIGGSSSSTSGGTKVIRVVVAAKLAKRGILKKLHPTRVIPIAVDGKPLRQETASNIVNFLFFYIFVLAMGTLVISLDDFDIMTTFSSVLTCLSNVGPGFNGVGPSMNFHHYSDFSKVVLAFLMIGGRLELFTLFMLLSPHYWNSNRA